MSQDPRPEHRIAKLLARAGIASRREIERMIADGRVALDGRVLDTPATLLRSLRGVTVDGDPVEAAAPARLFVYHKPPGLLVTERDPAGRPTIYDRLPPDLPRVVPVGRLDLATEGLLLLTTDGGFKRTLELPSTGVERAYRARAYGEITQARLEELIEGVEIDGIRYGPIDANLERRTGANVWIELILTEGKNREVRRVLEHLGLQVSRLIRTRYGPFILGDLPAGGVGEVRQHDLVAFAKSLKDGRPSAARVESVAPRAAARREPPAPPQPASRTGRKPSAASVSPDVLRRAPGRQPDGSARALAAERGGKTGSSRRRTGPGGAAALHTDQGSAERERRVNGVSNDAGRHRASRRDADPAEAPRPGFRAAPSGGGRPNARSARAAAFAERVVRERAGEAPARSQPRAAPGKRPRPSAETADARPGRTGLRAARPSAAAREDARAGTAGGWPDRSNPDKRDDRSKPTARPQRATDRSKPDASRSRPTTPRRPEDRGPPRGPRAKR